MRINNNMLTNPECQAKTDEELVFLVLKNPDNFLYIMDRYQAPLLRFIRRISGVSLADAEDILQEVYIKVYKNLNSFDISLKFSSWIYRITRNHVISENRKKRHYQEFLLDEDDTGENKFISRIDLPKEIDNVLNQEMIAKVLTNMDEKYREALVLRFLEEMDYQEMADILKKPIGTVGTLINRAKKVFYEELKKQKIIIN